MPNNLDSKSLQQILKETSRAFYLSLVILPAPAAEPLSLAYLLARAADTVADCRADLGAPRTETLRLLQEALLEPQSRLTSYLEHFSPELPGEQRLLRAAPQLFDELYRRSPSERNSIGEVVHTLIEGMLWDQQLFAHSVSEEGLTDEELERYTYLVAGCVGPFWTSVCASRDPKLRDLYEAPHLETAVEFGKALQWVNILRDIPKDQVENRYYLPHLSRGSFLPRFLWASKRALRAFAQAKSYPTFYPPSYVRERVAAVLPLVLGLRTLELLFASGGPRPERRVKVSKKEVFFWLVAGVILSLSNRTLGAGLNWLYLRAEKALNRLEKRI